ncbi:hypothetical protein JTE90_004061 [Oedothorax gibbosus]|uniref:Uncharacterized protein n=1 Tax=Oedothorax gibbosus TaxID=931172 RepID=A0AAV6U5Y7_9ARAC|nr:hypothetical protein JTE90_004061 [Oedothorax gibbosus]
MSTDDGVSNYTQKQGGKNHKATAKHGRRRRNTWSKTKHLRPDGLPTEGDAQRSDRTETSTEGGDRDVKTHTCRLSKGGEAKRGGREKNNNKDKKNARERTHKPQTLERGRCKSCKQESRQGERKSESQK